MFSRFLEGLSPGQAIALIAKGALGAMIMLHWGLWLFARGRFKETTDTRKPIRDLVADFLVKLINDFRHLLALAIVGIFGGTLAAVLCLARDFTNVKDGLQVVAATMGGLVGSIIGYYFGESAGKKVPEATVHEELPTSPPTQLAAETETDDSLAEPHPMEEG
jgi:hypothetical protein